MYMEVQFPWGTRLAHPEPELSLHFAMFCMLMEVVTEPLVFATEVAVLLP
jgi:hypothetical protein